MPPYPKQPSPVKDEAYLDLIRGLECCCCGRWAPSEVHHIMRTPLGIPRNNDAWVLPLCGECHRPKFHDTVGNEEAFFTAAGLPHYLRLSGNLWKYKGNPTAMGLVSMRQRLRSKKEALSENNS